mmetsp:Transcript_10081/g.42396  ORF Transcript_10081/g.42396 Transcript_10081/m.42396 type:complete len:279 (+) Transcript_10081:133-969(+)
MVCPPGSRATSISSTRTRSNGAGLSAPPRTYETDGAGARQRRAPSTKARAGDARGSGNAASAAGLPGCAGAWNATTVSCASATNKEPPDWISASRDAWMTIGVARCASSSSAFAASIDRVSNEPPSAVHAVISGYTVRASALGPSLLCVQNAATRASAEKKSRKLSRHDAANPGTASAADRANAACVHLATRRSAGAFANEASTRSDAFRPSISTCRESRDSRARFAASAASQSASSSRASATPSSSAASRIFRYTTPNVASASADITTSSGVDATAA